MSDREGGFTLIELIVAVVILTFGLLSLAAGTTVISRTLNRAKTATLASQVAQRRLDMLRAASTATLPRCQSAAFVSGGPVTTRGVVERWVVPTTGFTRTVLVVATYRLPAGRQKTDTLASLIQC